MKSRICYIDEIVGELPKTSWLALLSTRLQWNGLNFLPKWIFAFSFDQVNEAFAAAFRKLKIQPCTECISISWTMRIYREDYCHFTSGNWSEHWVFQLWWVDLDVRWPVGKWINGSYRWYCFTRLTEAKICNRCTRYWDWFTSLDKDWRQIGENHFWHPLHFDEDDYEGQVMFDDVRISWLFPKSPAG